MLNRKTLILIPALIALSGCTTLFGKQPKEITPETVPTSVFTPVAVNAPAEIAVPENQWALDLSTGGRVIIQLRPDIAPKHVERIKELTRAGFYNGLAFHRVIDGFMAQGGDPLGNGTGGSKLPDLPAEFNNFPHVRGSVSMARANEPNSANSQFFIVFQPRFNLDRNYTAFGRVISGMLYVDAIRRGEPPVVPSRIVQASILADNKPVPPVLSEAPLPAEPLSTDLNAPLAPATPTPPGN